MTEEIFRKNSYAQSCSAVVVDVDNQGVVLDKTVFYPMGGGQPGDIGILRDLNGREVQVIDTRKNRETGKHYHMPAEDQKLFEVGEKVEAHIDWKRRYRLMRMHSALHLLCSIVDGGVTGGQIGTEKSRLDFDLVEMKMDKSSIENELNKLVASNVSLAARWITEEEMEASFDLVRTMSVKPPSGIGEVRLIEIKNVDLQPCGGTHVATTGEIGLLRVGKIENKGRHNRRINLHLGEE